jgi:multiple sugar transport system substrate-binding protein
MPVIVGMAIPKNAGDKAAAERVIDHMTKPATQAIILKEIGFFPVVKSDLSHLPPGVQMASQGMSLCTPPRTQGVQSAAGAVGAKNGEFNKIFVDTFTRIVLRKEDVKAVLGEQGKLMDALIKEIGAPCWAPDASSGTPVCSVQ